MFIYISYFCKFIPQVKILKQGNERKRKDRKEICFRSFCCFNVPTIETKESLIWAAKRALVGTLSTIGDLKDISSTACPKGIKDTERY